MELRREAKHRQIDQYSGRDICMPNEQVSSMLITTCSQLICNPIEVFCEPTVDSLIKELDKTNS